MCSVLREGGTHASTWASFQFISASGNTYETLPQLSNQNRHGRHKEACLPCGEGTAFNELLSSFVNLARRGRSCRRSGRGLTAT